MVQVFRPSTPDDLRTVSTDRNSRVTNSRETDTQPAYHDMKQV